MLACSAAHLAAARGLAVQAARRHSQLHRWGVQRLHTRRGAAILQPFSAAWCMDHAVVLHTRARRSRIARRGVARRDFSLSDKLGRTHSHFDLPRPRTRYGDGIDQCESSQGYLRRTSATAEHALSQRLNRALCSTAAAHPRNARYAVGPRLHNTKRTKGLLPRSHRHKNSAGLPNTAHQKRPLRTTPPRPW